MFPRCRSSIVLSGVDLDEDEYFSDICLCGCLLRGDRPSNIDAATVTQHFYGQDIALYAHSVHGRSTIVLDDGEYDNVKRHNPAVIHLEVKHYPRMNRE